MNITFQRQPNPAAPCTLGDVKPGSMFQFEDPMPGDHDVWFLKTSGIRGNQVGYLNVENLYINHSLGDCPVKNVCECELNIRYPL